MLYDIIKERNIHYKPIWFMRQAGRHLKEYQILRSKYNSFINFCLNEEAIINASLMPLKNYNLDAVILFSDILIVPWVLGQEVSFIKNFGPKLRPLEENKESLINVFDLNKIASIGHAIKRIKNLLPKNKSLIGFSGAPWTLACYMIEGQGSRNFEKTRKTLWNNKTYILKLIHKLIESVSDFLEFQAKSGADVLMIFDTWSQMIPNDYWKELAIDPIKLIIQELKRRQVFCPVIGFPFKAGEKLIPYSYESGVDVISIDWNTDLEWVCKNINHEIITQGNLDPLLLTVNNINLISESVEKILKIVKMRPHIFNVGHGLTPQCIPKNVKHVIKIVKG